MQESSVKWVSINPLLHNLFLLDEKINCFNYFSFNVIPWARQLIQASLLEASHFHGESMTIMGLSIAVRRRFWCWSSCLKTASWLTTIRQRERGTYLGVAWTFEVSKPTYEWHTSSNIAKSNTSPKVLPTGNHVNRWNHGGHSHSKYHSNFIQSSLAGWYFLGELVSFAVQKCKLWRKRRL